MTRREYYVATKRDREARYAANKAEREARARSMRNRSMARRGISRASSAGGSVARTLFGSFDKVLSIVVALLLFFVMQKMVVADAIGLTITTPVMNALEIGDGVHYADVDAVNGIGYMTNASGEIQGRYFSFSSFFDDIVETVKGYGFGTGVLVRGFTALVDLIVDLFSDTDMMAHVTGKIAGFISSYVFDFVSFIDDLINDLPGTVIETTPQVLQFLLEGLKNLMGGIMV